MGNISPKIFKRCPIRRQMVSPAALDEKRVKMLWRHDMRPSGSSYTETLSSKRSSSSHIKCHPLHILKLL